MAETQSPDSQLAEIVNHTEQNQKISSCHLPLLPKMDCSTLKIPALQSVQDIKTSHEEKPFENTSLKNNEV